MEIKEEIEGAIRKQFSEFLRKNPIIKQANIEFKIVFASGGLRFNLILEIHPIPEIHPSEIYNGSVLTLDANGDMHYQEEYILHGVPNGSAQLKRKFWLRELKIIFDIEQKQFQVSNFGNVLWDQSRRY